MPKAPDEPLAVLLVEDDEDDIVITSQLLAQAASLRFTLDCARTYEEALATIAANTYDAYLVDYRLGAHTGLELVRELQATASLLTVIMLTGQNDYAVDLEATSLGVADYLVKDGLTPDLLERSIRYAVHTSAAVRALRESEERYALAVRGANDGVWDWSLTTERIYLSDRWKEMLGHRPPDIGDSPDEWLRRVHPDDLARLHGELDAHLKGSTPHLEVEQRMRHADGSWRWMLTRGIAVRDEAGTPQRIAGSLTDTTERKRAEEQLVHDALHDALTGLPNRALFMDRLTLAVGRARRRPDDRCAVVFLDVDRFKVVNDGLGHAAGDNMLVAIARRLESVLRPGDTVARLGGDEFTLLLDDIHDIAEVEAVVRRLQGVLAHPFSIEGREIVITASAGIAVSGTSETAEDLVRDADTAMYQAKGDGRARHEVFDRRMRDQVLRRLDVETELRRALDTVGLDPHYQPIVSVATRELAGFELLARWQNAAGERISPADFIPIAEDSALITEIGRWALRAGCTQLRSWQQAGVVSPSVTMSVNISGRHINHGDLAADVEAALAASGLPGSALRLEVTESVILDDPEKVRSTLMRLGHAGVRAHIDDFGTGYSSLAFLHRFPGDALKIDRSFVSSMCQDGGSRDIVRAITALARTLNMQVIAEGVETEWDLELVTEAGCHLVQGFLFSPAVPADAAAAFAQRLGGHACTP